MKLPVQHVFQRAISASYVLFQACFCYILHLYTQDSQIYFKLFKRCENDIGVFDVSVEAVMVKQHKLLLEFKILRPSVNLSVLHVLTRIASNYLLKRFFFKCRF